MSLENLIMELLVRAGSARSHALCALQNARSGDFIAADLAMAAAKESVNEAHHIQTELIGMDEGCGKVPVTLITVHAQDHLMNAMLIQDLATDFITLYRRLPQEVSHA
ncbi:MULTISPECIES: PTS lactose/cellobiose transporter subunit IIA [Erwinia]|jgi:PTS system cellobiose-specific IIA component|uniref:Phosphotransferase system lactose/cellobiose-specific IIA subunit n=1 Tax=Erwinia billingiae (strain Eb661) TaxID=634500 RepID=D8MXF7_ERWBE|nr:MULTISPECIES: PTS lactose/cellobiose transporter subunit IIA [Erwinia]MBN7122097.1 PTS lactose/cellobiose transporter subunit IIA [Erwinia billingiae]MCX0499246.1 PTS lactose/cellobiose transporter subunit IIA [Erwinia billingiae]PRB56734.1 PTS lactose/cellobiose transporter subunit IIA [Erwinia billingiae]QBR49250.1 PTS lactose/cellobiose transporter subunit IIA [Erwinia sp. QL-Z3]CAX61514.1 Phosphotransferase system lactose/cellobiose-specific IIA subunit [Erwinia billingiae Eb661]